MPDTPPLISSGELQWLLSHWINSICRWGQDKACIFAGKNILPTSSTGATLLVCPLHKLHCSPWRYSAGMISLFPCSRSIRWSPAQFRSPAESYRFRERINPTTPTTSTGATQNSVSWLLSAYTAILTIWNRLTTEHVSDPYAIQWFVWFGLG